MIEVNAEFQEANTTFGDEQSVMMITPPIDADYFIARVKLAHDQAIVIFPKFFTVGCGFAQEEDWNTNLPLGIPADQIYAHIRHNKKYEDITDEACIAAIRELQDWAEKMNLAGFRRLAA